METKIVRLGINGEGIGFYQRKPVFIKGALVDEVVEFQITKQFPKYYEGKLIKIVQKSKNRVKPNCKVQGKCDGCPFMILDYKKWKEKNRNESNHTL